ncbi:hypothetical protein MAPG_04909 [Magnaporthiopsis poae ATCC 64411]|uniref:Hypersensitive response-inducing protein n=1 Tax=Magnaporthiopsis poae (strain ATCC 64411 / 73-15) TaxID=644358 RepID=A0A0C4DY01_MAGP6|nr:hypothetical protein MAPG_04909 [Magnaporthiopsis poae ATCC 64411]
MQFLSALLLAGSASAASLQARQYPLLYVSNFTAACIPHSVRCTYSFGLDSQPSLGWKPTACNITLNGPDRLPNVTQAACERTFHFDVNTTAADAGLDLTVWQWPNSRTYQNYCHHIPGDQLIIEDHGAVQTQRYIGPTDFQVTVADCHNS